MARFKRLYDELLPGIDRVASLRPSTHAICLGEAVQYAAWALYGATWKSRVAFIPRPGGTETAWRIDPAYLPYCRQLITLYQWHQEDDLGRVFDRLCAQAPRLAPDAHDDVRRRLRSMAEDLATMRPLLARNYRPQRSAITLAPDVCVAWQWNLGAAVGNVLVAPDERALLESLRSDRMQQILVLGHDGLLALQDLPWRRYDSLPDPDAALAVNVLLVERLYARVFEMYQRVDTAAVLARFNTPIADTVIDADAVSDTDGGDAPVGDEAALAATLRERVNAETDAPDDAAEDAPGRQRRVHGMRFARFLRVLELFGCEVRAGKGSEVNVYRSGGRIARLGHHLRNPELSPVLVRIVLDQLAIPVADFVARM